MRGLAVALAFAFSAVIASSTLHAENAATASLKVEAPWLRATPKGAPVIGGYATITNSGTTPDRLTGADIPFAETAEVHSMTMKNGVMHMERLNDGLVVAPGTTVTLAPGGKHLMFFKPTQQIEEGEAIRGTMRFEKAGPISVTFAVGSIGATVAPNPAAVPAPSKTKR